MKVILTTLITICLISCGSTYQGTVDAETLIRQTAVTNTLLAEAIIALHNRLIVLEQQIETLDGGMVVILEWIKAHEALKAKEAVP